MLEDEDLRVNFNGQAWSIVVDGIRSERRFNSGVAYVRKIIQFIDDEHSSKAQTRMCCNREVDEEAWLRSGIVRFKG